MSRIYVETSIPSFYYEVRPDAKMVARRHWTRQWWDAAVSTESLWSSVAVIDELDKGNFPGKDDALKMARSMALLEISDAVEEIIESYLSLITSCRKIPVAMRCIWQLLLITSATFLSHGTANIWQTPTSLDTYVVSMV